MSQKSVTDQTYVFFFKWNTLYIIQLLNRARRDDFNDTWFVGLIYNSLLKK